MFILKFLFVLLLLGFFAIVVFLFSVWQQVKGGFRRFRQEAGQRQPQQQEDGNIVIDHRSDEEANKKIIPSDEGEYVDFETVSEEQN